LSQVALDFKFSEALASFEEFVEGLVMTEFEDDIDIIKVLKRTLKLND